VALDDPGGVIDQVRQLNASKPVLFDDIPAFTASDDSGLAEIAYQWTATDLVELYPLVNEVSTPEGGMHVEGFKKSLSVTINKYARAHGLLQQKDGDLLGEDIREGLTAVISVRLDDPEFEGRNNRRLFDLGIRSLVERATREHLATWLEDYPERSSLVIQKLSEAARVRRQQG
jgi:DNA gyrase subunit B